MGLFGRKKDDLKEFEDFASNSKVAGSAAERIVMEQLIDDEAKLLSLADQLKDGHPLIVDFSKIKTDAALNKSLAFLSGVAYALDGKIVTLNETIFVFAKKTDFIDGTLQEFIDQIPR